MRQPETVRQKILRRWAQRLTARLRQAAGHWAGSVWGTVQMGQRSVWVPIALLGFILAGLVVVRPPTTGPLSELAARPQPPDTGGGSAALARSERRARVEELLRGVSGAPGNSGSEPEATPAVQGAATPSEGPRIPAGPTEPLRAPVAAAPTRSFGWAHSVDTGDYRLHPGVDFVAPAGTTVRAVAAGTVSAVEQDVLYGTTVTVAHNEGWQTRYGGLDGVQIRPGDAVAPGTVLGAVGQPGGAEAAAGTHLHFEVRLGGEPVDPIPYLTPAQPAVTPSPSTPPPSP